MENLNLNKTCSKYEQQIKLRKEKLEKLRKERAILQNDKEIQKENNMQKKLEDIRLNKEIREKAKLIKDV